MLNKLFYWTRGLIWKAPPFLRPFFIWIGRLIRSVAVRTENEKAVRISLSLGVEYLYGAEVNGDIAEFGSMTGRTATVIARMMRICEIFRKKGLRARNLHFFDSFEGLPEMESAVDKDSPSVQSGLWGAGGCLGVTPDELRKMTRKYISNERIHIYKGWFKDTLSSIPRDAKFAMVHIDSDLYQSAIEVLSYIFEKGHVVEGAMIFFDDFNCSNASPLFGERRAWKETIDRFNIKYIDCGPYGWGGWKFLVNSYKGMAS